jgi:ATP-dependent DNA helicase RecQ
VIRSVFESLRTLRRELAAAANVPPYAVFADSTLRAMAGARPKTPDAMARISGVRASWKAAARRFEVIRKV